MLTRVYFIAVLCFTLVLGLKNFQVLIKHSKLEKLTTKSDLIEYLVALNRLIDFSSERENNFDINYFFGLFLANVNLRRVLQEKYQVLPKKLHTYVTDIIQKTEKFLEFFKYTIEENDDLRKSKYGAIFSLFSNTTAWIYRVPKFNTTYLNEAVPYLDTVYTKWILYKKYIDDRNSWVPNPRQSDQCLASLASAENIRIGTSRKCIVLKSCYEMVENGTDFGYALTHRLLFLQQARFGRGCSVFSVQDDARLRRRFCSTAYREAEYIAQHDFEIVDLLLEHVCLCALEGYAQFLKRSWLTKILRFQTQDGCFPSFPKSPSHRVSPSSDRDIDGSCNAHTTAVAAGSIAMAIRFILHFHY